MERLLVIFLPLLCSQALATSPLLIWNSHEAPGHIPAIPALGSTSYTSLWKDYLQAFPSDNIILFMQDAMSIEDLTSFPEENAELNNLLSRSHHLYLPSVEETSSLRNDFESAGYNIVEVSKEQSGLDLKKEGQNLVLIQLPETLTIPQRKQAMQKTNEVIGSALSKIGGLAKFTCIFTANKTSKESNKGSSIYKRSITRSLQQASNRPMGFHNHSCALIYLRRDIEINVINKDGVPSTFVIPNNKSVADLDTGHCVEGKESTVQITYRDVENVPGATGPIEIRLEFKFVITKKGKWTLQLVEGNLDTKGKDLVFMMNKQQNEVVPLKMSYSCSVKRVLPASNATTSGATMKMVLNGFQYEAFPKSSNPGKFDGAWDCVGFFTVPVWMSLISVLIFLIVLFWGLWMLADVKTMDRFDDPKGKSIVVPNTD